MIWDIGKYVPTAPVLQESFDATNALLCNNNKVLDLKLGLIKELFILFVS